MVDTRKRIIMTLMLVIPTIILIFLGVLALFTESFVIDAILHSYMRLFTVPIVIKLLHKSFKDQICVSMNKMLILCGIVIFLDMVVIDAFRFVFSNGISTILFLPACIPLCFMIIMHYSVKDAASNKKGENNTAYIVGIILLILSVYIEVLSFIKN